MNGLTIRRILFYIFFTVTTLLCCSGNLAFAKAVAPITVYLSKKSLVHIKEQFEVPSLVRNIGPEDEAALVKHANLVMPNQKNINMEWL